MKHNVMSLALKISSKLSVIFLVFLCSFTTWVNGKTYVCTQVGCGCQYSNGNETFEISLEKISNKESYFYKPAKDGEFTYWVDPCYGFTYAPSNHVCTDVTLCQFGYKHYFPVARYNIKDFGNYDEEKKVLGPITYVPVSYATPGAKKSSRQMILTVQYADTVSIDASQKSGENIYEITIKSPNIESRKVQPTPASSSGGGLSTGSILVIIFFVVLVIYVVSGILFMKYRRGATGKEVIPNVDFWSSLPGLIKDGCVFFGKKIKELCERCCNREGYNEI